MAKKTAVINRTKIFGNKLTDFRVVIERGFVRVQRIYVKYLFGIPTWKTYRYVMEEKKKKGFTVVRAQHFQTRDNAVRFINHELEAMGSQKRVI
jgi:hypothetical protein